MTDVIKGILIPFVGTSLGSACVFYLKNNLNSRVQSVLAGFAAGVMTAASIWSLLIPSIEQSEKLGRLAFIPAAVGFLIGIGFLMLLDMIIPKISRFNNRPISKNSMLLLAVTLHNIPEGMAVGVVCAGMIYGNSDITAAAALSLSIGIAVQNFPEGAIISLPLHADGVSKSKAFLCGVLSGAAEPLGAVLTILAAGFIVPLMPCFLSFAAGAMIYVVIVELVPEMNESGSKYIGSAAFSIGFSGMMILDVALG